jgi:hypothetical protein
MHKYLSRESRRPNLYHKNILLIILILILNIKEINQEGGIKPVNAADISFLEKISLSRVSDQVLRLGGRR